MAARDYLSIGEVLASLKREFPDVTVSKIRFLESEGLIAPERTPSGYRKFYEPDVRRLRRILRMQRDEYLPLRVIRQRLDRAEEEGASLEAEEAADEGPEAALPEGDVQMSAEELAKASGLEVEQIEQLATYGLLRPRPVGQTSFFDGDDLVVAQIVKALFKYGVEPRHLTLYRHFAEREAAFLQALLLPVLRQRNPEARRKAARSLSELSVVARRLKQALLRRNLRAPVGDE